MTIPYGDDYVEPLDRLEKMLSLQLELQRGYGFDIAAMTDEERVEYARYNQQALVAESVEALDETSWKPWASGTWFNDSAYSGELVDGWHFFMNMVLCAAHGDPKQAAHLLYDGYVVKRSINQQRQRTDYDGVSTKCPHCKRELDKPGAIVRIDVPTAAEPNRGHWMCKACGQSFSDEFVEAVNKVLSTT